MNDPVLIGFRRVSHIGHVRFQLFAGRNRGSRGNCGDLMCRPDEWATIHDALLRGGFEEMPEVVLDAHRTLAQAATEHQQRPQSGGTVDRRA